VTDDREDKKSIGYLTWFVVGLLTIAGYLVSFIPIVLLEVSGRLNWIDGTPFENLLRIYTYPMLMLYINFEPYKQLVDYWT